MRISDWSSDVCSSDLTDGTDRRLGPVHPRTSVGPYRERGITGIARAQSRHVLVEPLGHGALEVVVAGPGVQRPDRKSVVWGKSVAVRVDLGGRRIMKKKKQYNASQ